MIADQPSRILIAAFHLNQPDHRLQSPRAAERVR